MCFQRPYIIPLLTGILSVCSMVVIYFLSSEEELVYPILPSLGDLMPIEKAGKTYRHLAIPSFICQWFLLIFSLLVSTIIYIRYRQLRFICDNPDIENQSPATKMSIFSLWIGFMMSSSIMILPYCIYYFPTQYVGIVVWLLILTYEILEVISSILVYQEIEIKRKIRIIIFFKALVFIISAAMLFVSKVFWEICIRKFAPERLGSNYASQQPGDWGYDAHFISAVCEWIFAIATLIYFCVLLAADFFFVHFTEPELDIKCGRCH